MLIVDIEQLSASFGRRSHRTGSPAPRRDWAALHGTALLPVRGDACVCVMQVGEAPLRATNAGFSHVDQVPFTTQSRMRGLPSHRGCFVRSYEVVRGSVHRPQSRPRSDDAGSIDADRQPCTLDAGRPRSAVAGPSRLCADARGLEVSLRQLLEHVDIQPLVFGPEFLEALGVGGFQAAEGVAPAMPGLLGDLQVPNDFGQVLPLVEHLLGDVELAHESARACADVASRGVLLRHIVTLGLSRFMDSFPGAAPDSSVPLAARPTSLSSSR